MDSRALQVFLASLALLAFGDITLRADEKLCYRAHLVSPGGELEFELVLDLDGEALRQAEIVNGPERVAVNDATLESDRLTLSFPHYNSQIVAHLPTNRKTIEGTWTKNFGAKKTEMRFRATLLDEASSSRQSPVADSRLQGFAGRWRVKFESSDDPAVGLFSVHNNLIEGTFLTTTGDYRYLSGRVREGTMRLATFDGTHAFLCDAQIQADGSLSGNFWSGTSWHETWTAVRDEQAALPDGFEQIHWSEQPNWSEIQLHDLKGNEARIDPESTFGELTILSIFGSWCPNCHDEAPFLVKLQEEFGPHGLRIVGLAFEASGEIKQDAAQVKRYVDRHSIPFPVYLAGISDKGEAAQKLGFVNQLKAFPTTVFVNKAGKIVAAYSGFSGPATGDEHEKLKQQFESLIRRHLQLDGEKAP